MAPIRGECLAASIGTLPSACAFNSEASGFFVSSAAYTKSLQLFE